MVEADMVDTSSSMIKSIGHDGDDLFVKFTRGQVYMYKDVPVDVFDELNGAQSVGKYFAEYVKDNYSCSKTELE